MLGAALLPRIHSYGNTSPPDKSVGPTIHDCPTGVSGLPFTNARQECRAYHVAGIDHACPGLMGIGHERMEPPSDMVRGFEPARMGGQGFEGIIPKTLYPGGPHGFEKTVWVA